MADSTLDYLINRAVTRRQILQLLGVGASGLTLGSLIAACGTTTASTSSSPRASGSFLPLTGTGSATILDSGPPYAPAYKKVFYDPLKAQYGIGIDQQTRPSVESAAATQMRAQEQTGQVLWDALQLSSSTYVLVKRQGLLQDVGMDKYDFHLDQFAKGANQPDFSAAITVGLVLAYNKNKYTGANVPKTFADYWNVDKFPGRRGLFKSALDLMEPAVLSAGIDQKKVYPIDVDLAFKQLDKIKPHVDVWYDQLAVSAQLLQSGSVDMAITFISRVQAAAAAGAPVTNAWGQWISANNGWVILKGASNAQNAQKALAFMTDPMLMGQIPSYVPVGLPNLKAYDYVDKSIVNTLPGSPPTQAGQVPVDPNWRADNTAAVTERFVTWFSS